MITMNDGIEIARFMKIPSSVIRTVIGVFLIVSTTVFGTLRYADAKEKEVASTRLYSKIDTLIRTNLAIVIAVEGLQKNTIDHSHITEKTWIEANELFLAIISKKEPEFSILKEKDKKMREAQAEKLPHLNGTLKIGIKPKK